MPPFRAALVVTCVLLLAGCGFAKEEKTATREVKRADLRRMVVLKANLGQIARGLTLDGEGTGRADNRKAAEDSIDPKDTARTLARAGRIQGYELTYSASRPSPLGVTVVSQGVELFRTKKAASRYLKKSMDDYRRFRGRTIDGIKLVRAESFDVDVGDDAAGLNLTVSSPATRRTVFGTIVVFRRGRVVGGAAVVLRRRLIVSGDAERIAGAVDERLQDLMSGKARARASAPDRKAPRTPDPKPLTLEAKDFPLRTRPGHQGYVPSSGVRVYLREYDVLGGSLAGSKVLYLRTMAQVFASPRAAARNQAYLATINGARSVARRFVRAGFSTTSFTPRRVTASPIHSNARDTAAFHFFFRTPKGRIEGVLVSVARGRFTASVLVMGYAPEVDPADVLSARAKLRAALRRR